MQQYTKNHVELVVTARNVLFTPYVTGQVFRVFVLSAVTISTL